jgi:hypothetical protein
MVNDSNDCAFCNNLAIARIERSDCPICATCLEVYMCGQDNPDGEIIEISEVL